MKIMSQIHLWLILLLLITFSIIYSCSSPNTGGAVSSASAKIVTCPTTTSTSVSISQSAFQPPNVSITVNDIVKWTNNDSITHTVTSGTPGSQDGNFDSGNLTPNTSVCIQFLAAGSYSYFCTIHVFMTGIVKVQ